MLMIRVNCLEVAKDILTGAGINLATKDEIQEI